MGWVWCFHLCTEKPTVNQKQIIHWMQNMFKLKEKKEVCKGALLKNTSKKSVGCTCRGTQTHALNVVVCVAVQFRAYKHLVLRVQICVPDRYSLPVCVASCLCDLYIGSAVYNKALAVIMVACYSFSIFERVLCVLAGCQNSSSARALR